MPPHLRMDTTLTHKTYSEVINDDIPSEVGIQNEVHDNVADYQIDAPRDPAARNDGICSLKNVEYVSHLPQTQPTRMILSESDQSIENVVTAKKRSTNSLRGYDCVVPHAKENEKAEHSQENKPGSSPVTKSENNSAKMNSQSDLFSTRGKSKLKVENKIETGLNSSSGSSNFISAHTGTTSTSFDSCISKSSYSKEKVSTRDITENDCNNIKRPVFNQAEETTNALVNPYTTASPSLNGGGMINLSQAQPTGKIEVVTTDEQSTSSSIGFHSVTVTAESNDDGDECVRGKASYMSKVESCSPKITRDSGQLRQRTAAGIKEKAETGSYSFSGVPTSITTNSSTNIENRIESNFESMRTDCFSPTKIKIPPLDKPGEAIHRPSPYPYPANTISPVPMAPTAIDILNHQMHFISRASIPEHLSSNLHQPYLQVPTYPRHMADPNAAYFYPQRDNIPGFGHDHCINGSVTAPTPYNIPATIPPSLHNAHLHNTQNFAVRPPTEDATIASSHQHSHMYNIRPTEKASDNSINFTPSSSGRRSIKLRLVEDALPKPKLKFFKSSVSRLKAERRYITVSWYEGTTTTELQNHVRNIVSRKLNMDIADIRLLDEEVIPNEEVVLTPYIPSGSKFLLKFVVAPPTKTIYNFASKAPESPSRAPTPLQSSNDLPSLTLGPSAIANNEPKMAPKNTLQKPKEDFDSTTQNMKVETAMASIKEVLSSPVAAKGKPNIIIKPASRSHEKRHVVFVLANYFVLFISLIAISAEISERLPMWMEWMENNIDRVNNCAVDQDALFKCVSDGDFSGLVASLFLWVTSKTTRRFFLFGFESVHKLWTVVYESLVTALCWGTSYLFIRRGLNPDTSTNFLAKYWKDCAYGSLAGFNASFMKAVMKNLIPREAIEDMLEENPRLRIVDWLVRHLNH